MKRLLKKYPDAKKLIYPLDDGSIEAIVGHFYRLFPTHSLKFLQALITIELNALEANNTTNIIGWPNITFLDIGCGAGRAALYFQEKGHSTINVSTVFVISPIGVRR